MKNPGIYPGTNRFYYFGILALAIHLSCLNVGYGQLKTESLIQSPAFYSESDSTYQYAWYTPSGKRTTFEKVAKQASRNQIILFGELHNDRLSHHFQLELYKGLISKNPGKVVLGMEMLETHQQPGVDSFLLGYYTDSAFIKAHKLWPNHLIDYHPLLQVAREQKLRCIATNVPRKYARQVSKYGPASLDTLSEAEKRLICPLPYVVDTTLNCYRQLLSMGHGDKFNGYFFASAQALKDACMAHFTLQNWKEDEVFLHLNGAYHSDFHESIVWYLKQNNPKLKILVISTTESDHLKPKEKDEFKKGDYLLVTHPNNPKSYKD